MGIIISFCSLSCGALDYHLKSIDETIQFFKETREKYEIQYVGKTQELVRSDLGNPYFIRYNVFIKGETYDEQWSYHINKGQGLMKTVHTLSFYIKKGKVTTVDVW